VHKLVHKFVHRLQAAGIAVCIGLLAGSTCLAASSSASSSSSAPPAGTVLPGNTELDKHVMAISEELRCLVCQNQTIADSHADLALDLRKQVREKLEQGMADKDVIDYMVQRYGDFVRYKPPFKPSTWLLWTGPFILLAGGIGFFLISLRRRRQLLEQAPAADLARAAGLLHANDVKKEST